ncbi:MAG TPA: hypothetical protein VKQ27_20795, partial [Acetobacteraceae bacterium]|nr:hypothetical protein [Acetobacteraceae bacterium]
MREGLVGIVPGYGKRQPCQCRNRLRTGFLHDRGAMILDGALADAKVRGDILAGVSRKDERHDLMLTWRELRD